MSAFKSGYTFKFHKDIIYHVVLVHAHGVLIK